MRHRVPTPHGAGRFTTPWGQAGLAWTHAGICHLVLPHLDANATDQALLQHTGCDRLAMSLPAPWAAVATRLAAHLGGTRDALTDVPLDLTQATPFARRVYADLRRRVPPGKTISYHALANALGHPSAARAVGQAMAKNGLPLLVPCHRVLPTQGGLGHYSAAGGAATKLRLLTVEGIDPRSFAPAGVRLLARNDPTLRAIIRRVGAFTLLHRPRTDPFTALAKAIVHQQLSMKAGGTIFRRLSFATVKGATLCPMRLLALTDTAARDIGVSQSKWGYLRNLAEVALDGGLALETLSHLDDEDVIARLTRVKGIGRWSAEMFLLFELGRLDVLPVDDLGLRRGVMRAYQLGELPRRQQLLALAAPWSPYRSIATWYLWRMQDTP